MTNFPKSSIMFFVWAGTLLCAGSDPDAITIPLHDSSRPPTIHVHTMIGGIAVRGEDRNDILVENRASHSTRENRENREDHEPRSDGMRRLDLGSLNGLDVTEDNNVVSIKTDIFGRHGGEIVVEVPRHASLELKSMTGGEITVENVDGEIEVDNMNGAIHLKDVAGSVVAHSQNGAVSANLKRVDPAKPMSFSTMNGDIDVTLPPDVKARVSLKTDNGEILSDFDVKLEAPVRALSPGSGRQPDGSFHVRLDKTLHGTINGGGPEYQFRSFNGKIFIRKGK
jgi:hypothetical protein